jgi:hypothetical protein
MKNAHVLSRILHVLQVFLLSSHFKRVGARLPPELAVDRYRSVLDVGWVKLSRDPTSTGGPANPVTRLPRMSSWALCPGPIAPRRLRRCGARGCRPPASRAVRADQWVLATRARMTPRGGNASLNPTNIAIPPPDVILGLVPRTHCAAPVAAMWSSRLPPACSRAVRADRWVLATRAGMTPRGGNIRVKSQQTSLFLTNRSVVAALALPAFIASCATHSCDLESIGVASLPRGYDQNHPIAS